MSYLLSNRLKKIEVQMGQQNPPTVHFFDEESYREIEKNLDKLELDQRVIINVNGKKKAVQQNDIIFIDDILVN